MGKLNSIAIFTPLHIKKGWFIAFVFFFIPAGRRGCVVLFSLPRLTDRSVLMNHINEKWQPWFRVMNPVAMSDSYLICWPTSARSGGGKEHVKRRPRVRRRKYFGSFNTLVHELANNKATEWIYSEDTVPCICFEIQRIISCCWNVFV